ncbi:MAG TPA: type I secretion system permease/ATPase [Devosia sp.]|jgi:ATP-binding cassette subfamily C protein LapB|uniref:type I secretion system permease/ATPase n=1 Tax=Devosia sp. TaxID=1871048 RepID=UPI002DDD7EF0|nr:type I secretion system permease/ATPase [Devosia sp.]HEV2516410.1 type I secretion system permease/ATPase [Devosia sp.]
MDRHDTGRDESAQPKAFAGGAWLEALRHIAQHYGVPLSMQGARQSVRWSTATAEIDRVHALARTMGLRLKFVEPDEVEISSWQLPLVVLLRGGRLAVVTALSASGEASAILTGNRGLQTPLPLDLLLDNAEAVVIARPSRAVPDSRIDTYIRPHREGWLRGILFRDLRPYLHVVLASLVSNVLGLAGVIFSMQVYDRVVPSESLPTLYVLFAGVLLALIFDFLMRHTRASIIDILGKRADIRMSDQVFGHALRVRNRARPASTGSFIAQLRDLEQVRDMLTSTTVTALVDIPFFLLFLVVFWFIGGVLILVPIGALLLLLIPGLLAQRRLRAYANEAMRESSLRNAMLVEAVQGIEDIKALQAEERFQQQWNHFNAVTGEAQLKLRALTSMLSTWTQSVQTGAYAVVIFFGAPLVITGDMTTGTLVAASILGSRMVAPLAQITLVLSRLQHAKVGMQSLDQIMRMPIDHPPDESRIEVPRIAGEYRLRSAVFRYGDETSPNALAVRDLHIEPGEKIALLGKNGAGKSTLLQALSGLLEPVAGEVLLDNMALAQLDPADVRRDTGLLTQNARLFHGTLRDNLLMGAPEAGQDEILAALAMVGADEFVRRLPRGLEHQVLEGGLGLSGGQKQSILLARLLIRQPTVLLLDEPTAAMDEATERHFIKQLGLLAEDRTLVIATHRMRVLELVDRIVVIDNGLIALDDTRENALKRMQGMSNVVGGGR